MLMRRAVYDRYRNHVVFIDLCGFTYRDRMLFKPRRTRENQIGVHHYFNIGAGNRGFLYRRLRQLVSLYRVNRRLCAGVAYYCLDLG